MGTGSGDPVATLGSPLSLIMIVKFKKYSKFKVDKFKSILFQMTKISNFRIDSKVLNKKVEYRNLFSCMYLFKSL